MSTAQRQWLLLVAGTIGAAGSLVMVFLILSAQAWRLDLTPQGGHTLSPHAVQVLEALEQDVEITAFLRSDDPRNRGIRDLLFRIEAASGRVRYRVLDVNRNPAVARAKGVETYGAIVVESGGRRVDVSHAGQDTLIAAIVQVTRPAERVVHYVTGHGERSLYDPGDRQGLSRARAALVTERYRVREVRTVSAERTADADVILVAGPTADLLTGELLALDAYLRAGGALLVLLDPGGSRSLAAFLGRYGVATGDEVVLDEDNRLFAGDWLTILVTERSKAHPVSAGLAAAPLFSHARPVRFRETPRALRGLELLSTAPESWRTADPQVIATGKGELVSGRDTAGPVPVGVSVLVEGDDPERPGRILVYGDADFASNRFLGYLGNRDLLLNSASWLAGERGLIAPRAPKQIPGVTVFFVDARQGRLAFWLATVVQPSIVFVIGVIVFLRRRWRG